MGAEQWLTTDFLAAVQGQPISDQYLTQYPMPENYPGWGGRSVNHHMLALGCGVFDTARRKPNALDDFDAVMRHWENVGWADHENGSRNTYTCWNMAPVMAVWDQHNLWSAGQMVRAFWAELALGAAPHSVRKNDGSNWKGYGTTLTGARSVKKDGDYWSHQERHYSDPWLDYAVNNNVSALNGVWVQEWVQAGCVHGLTADERADLRAVMFSAWDRETLDRVVAMLLTAHEATLICRTIEEEGTLRFKSHNGNTQYNYAVVNDSNRRQHFLLHGDGTRNVKQGKAWIDGDDWKCASNDGSEGPTSIKQPVDGLIYEVYCSGRGKPFELTYPVEDPPVEPPEPPTEPEPPEDDMLSASERDHYVEEIRAMADRQNKIANDLEKSSSRNGDIKEAQNLTHQANKAARLSREIAEICDHPTQNNALERAKT